MPEQQQDIVGSLPLPLYQPTWEQYVKDYRANEKKSMTNKVEAAIVNDTQAKHNIMTVIEDTNGVFRLICQKCANVFEAKLNEHAVGAYIRCSCDMAYKVLRVFKTEASCNKCKDSGCDCDTETQKIVTCSKCKGSGHFTANAFELEILNTEKQTTPVEVYEDVYAQEPRKPRPNGFLDAVQEKNEKRIALPLAENPRKVTLVRLASGTIDIEQGADGLYLQFNAPCLEALPYCKARCCQLSGLDLSGAEAQSGLYIENVSMVQGENGDYELKRRADGYCVFNGSDCKCSIYDNRPVVCSSFHCSIGVNQRGWRLELNRLPGF